MPSTITPSWTDALSVIAASTLSLGGLAEGSIDLRGKNGAMLQIELGRKGATAPASAAGVTVYRALNNDAAPAPRGAYLSLASSTSASNATTCATSDSNAGQKVLTVASGTGFVAGDTICVYDASFTRLEWATVSKVSGAALTLNRSLQYTHTSAAADNVTRVADIFAPVWLVGGSLYVVVADYGASATGSDMVVRATAQRYDSDAVSP